MGLTSEEARACNHVVSRVPPSPHPPPTHLVVVLPWCYMRGEQTTQRWPRRPRQLQAQLSLDSSTRPRQRLH